MNENKSDLDQRFPLVSSFACRQPPFTGGHPELECGPCTAEAQRAATLRQAAQELRQWAGPFPLTGWDIHQIAAEWEALTEVNP